MTTRNGRVWRDKRKERDRREVSARLSHHGHAASRVDHSLSRALCLETSHACVGTLSATEVAVAAEIIIINTQQTQGNFVLFSALICALPLRLIQRYADLTLFYCRSFITRRTACWRASRGQRPDLYIWPRNHRCAATWDVSTRLRRSLALWGLMQIYMRDHTGHYTPELRRA